MSLNINADAQAAITLTEIETQFPDSEAAHTIKKMRRTIKQFAADLKQSHTDHNGDWPDTEHRALSKYMQLILLANS